MRIRLVSAAIALSGSIVVAGCGTSSGAGTPAPTTLKLGTPTYVTITMPAPPTTPPPPPGAPITHEQDYTVQPGDYLLGIATKFCVTAQQIADYNGWVDGIAHALQPSKPLKIPSGGCLAGGSIVTVPGATTIPPLTATTLPLDPGKGGTYVVVDGDTLSGIATRTGVTVDAIVQANHWKDGARHVIYAGLKIKIPKAG
ncbi:MAG: putative peptidoglycan-binding protein [Ilumatobacteraceae bacterium]|nr:putative peptidoglycan-binding protein [Ilumatobacteraceae bacterium]